MRDGKNVCEGNANSDIETNRREERTICQPQVSQRLDRFRTNQSRGEKKQSINKVNMKENERDQYNQAGNEVAVVITERQRSFMQLCVCEYSNIF